MTEVEEVSLLPLRPLAAAVSPAALEKAAALPLPHLVEEEVVAGAEVAVVAVVAVAAAGAPTKITIARCILLLAPVRRTSQTTQSTVTVPAPAGL